MSIKIAIALLTLAPAIAHAGEIHRWVDDDGRVHYGDRPPATRQAETVVVTPNVYASPSTEKLAEDFPVPTQVVMYSAAWCGYCKQAREYFKARRIRFREYDVETSRKGRRDYRRLRARSVPVILVGGHRLNGFNKTAFNLLYSEN